MLPNFLWMSKEYNAVSALFNNSKNHYVNLDMTEAIMYLGLNAKVFSNYFKYADEFRCNPRERGQRYYFYRRDLDKWYKSYKWRMVNLNYEDYKLCLDFALAQHFKGYVLSDWGTARQREFGQKITNWVKGQLAEVAVKKFLKKEFDFDVELDFSIYENIVPQDIIKVKDKGFYREPKCGVGIKSSKPKSAFLVLSENEVKIPERRSDIYVFCRPDIPDDHLLRLTRDKIIETVKNQQHFYLYEKDIPYFEDIPCEIAGWCRVNDLEKKTEIPGQKFDGIRYVKASGHLHKTKQSWIDFIQEL
jgi:hypothetical protein